MEMPTIDSIKAGANSAIQATKDFAVWTGHKISVGYNDYLVPTVTKLWDGIQNGFRTAYNDYLVPGANKTMAAVELGYNEYAKPAAITSWNFTVTKTKEVEAFLRTGKGVGSVCIGAALGLLVIAERESLQGDDCFYHRVTLRVAATALAATAGWALAQGSNTIL